MLDELLYKDRALFDYPDKQLSIIPIEYWAYFERYRQVGRDNAEKYPDVHALTEQMRSFIREKGAVCSDDIKLDGEVKWWSPIHWSAGTKMSKAVLDQMYATGELVIHHKAGTRKYYDLAEKHIPASTLTAPDPLTDNREHDKWRVLRRIGAVGLMWNRPSDAWLNIWSYKATGLNWIFNALLEEDKIFEIAVEGQNSRLYGRTEDLPLIETVLRNPELKPRCEFIAPLDCLIWDRKLIQALFGFHYGWEIYTPPHKRKYGAYTLPVIYGENFVGRVDTAVIRETKTLVLKNIWYEESIRQTKKLEKAIDDCLSRFAKFNGCDNIQKNEGAKSV
jgi:hypothetical protein